MSRLAIEKAQRGHRLSNEDALSLVEVGNLEPLLAAAQHVRDEGHGRLVSYSRKVFIPLTQLCRDSCHYCTFAHPPRRGEAAYLTPDQVLAIAERGARAGCKEALFTLGDKPELRYRAARVELDGLGFATTIDYLAAMARLVFERTSLLPHVNPGVMTDTEIARLREVSVSQGIMLETASERLSRRGGPHFGSPDKVPAVRLATIAAAGRLKVPFTSGILIGIGETRPERVEALLALRDLNDAHGHIQEIIIQNFRAKPGTRMAASPEPSLAEHQWTIAVARLVFGPAMNIQAPPNLRAGTLGALIDAGINDWGGVSPVTIDHVNPEAPWPEIEALAGETRAAGKELVERLAIYPDYALDPGTWTAPQLSSRVLERIDAAGLARTDGWRTGTDPQIPRRAGSANHSGDDPTSRALRDTIAKAEAGETLNESEVVRLFAARGAELEDVCQAADRLRRRTAGDAVSYVVNRNINYTNVCYFKCQFCAFSKGKLAENLRGRPYVLDLDEIERRTREAWARGATEVCLQGGIHPEYTGRTYLDICARIKASVPEMHIHAFSPLEITQGAATLGLTIPRFLSELKAAGLGSLPGTAAEILDDEVRRIICPDKIKTDAWLDVMRAAHGVGLRSTATIMFGHIDHPRHWARHLLRVRALQAETGGFTEFVPLPFVAAEAPIYLKGRARPGPTWREALLMHAVARLTLHPVLTSIQTSWVKLGARGAAACLQAGANDLGGTLMNESITRAAGATHGQEMAPAEMEALISSLDRTPRQRTTLYGTPLPGQVAASYRAAPLEAIVEPPAKAYQRAG